MTRRGLTRSVLPVLPVLGVLLLPALGSCTDDGGDPDGTHVVEVRGAHVAFTVEVPEDWGITWVDDAAVCGSAHYELGDLVLQAVPTVCDEATANDRIGNGFHGVYRTVEDVPEPRQITTVDTALGPAQVFTQSYFECTNSCSDWDEPVAIVTLEEPVDPEYPTLVVRAEQDDVSREDLETIVESLALPYTGASQEPVS